MNRYDNNEIGDLSLGENLDIDTVKKRAVRGVAVLTGRTFILSLLSFASIALLTVFLTPEDFGLFWIVSSVVNFFAYFSDVGLAAALIQKKESLDNKDLNTTFFVQQGLVLLLLVILFIITPYLRHFYSLSGDGVYLIYALGVALLLSSLKTIPSVMLERDLDFTKLVVPQIVENIFYNFAVVYFAWKGFGVLSFTYAVLIRGIVGLITIYILKPWIPSFNISVKSLKKLLLYGIPYQANTLLATIKDDGMTAFLGGVVGTYGVGLLGWAQKWAYMPLRLFMDHVLKVTFPAFSRMQTDKNNLKKSLTRSILFVSVLVFPSAAGLLITAPILIEIIPRYDKWRPALIPLYFISVNTFIGSFTTQLTNMLNAVGKIKITFKLMIMWTALTWLFVPVLGKYFGYNGAAFGYSLVSLSSFIALYIVYKLVQFDYIKSVIKPFIAALVMFLTLIVIREYFISNNILGLGIVIISGIFIYFSMLYVLLGEEIINDIKRGVSSFIKK